MTKLIAMAVVLAAVLSALVTYVVLNEVERHTHHQIGYGSVMICQPWKEPQTWICNT